MTATNAPSYATELRAEQKAHEPSMEDILASIRRMIADDDALPLSSRARATARSRIGTPGAEPASPQKAPADAFLSLVHRLGRESGDQTDISPSPAPVTKAVAAEAPAVDQAGPGEARQETGPEPAPAPVPKATPTLKLRDFALKNFMARPASLNEAPARATLAQTPAETESTSAPLAAGDAPGAAETRLGPAAEPAMASAGASVVMLSPRPSPAADIRLKIAPLTFRPPVFAAPPAPPVALAPVPEPVAEKTPALEPPTPSEAALLSSASGAKIGASFEALAESLLARDKDLVERAAREMLRPMLKSWLDDHLPSLVERLVRAEIERVARGRD